MLIFTCLKEVHIVGRLEAVKIVWRMIPVRRLLLMVSETVIVSELRLFVLRLLLRAQIVRRSEELLVGALANLLTDIFFRGWTDEAHRNARQAEMVTVTLIARVVMNRFLVIHPMLVELMLQLCSLLT